MNTPGRKKSKLRLSIFSQYFWPEDFRINELVKYFFSKHHDVQVFTSNPSYPQKFFYSSYYNNKMNYRNYEGVKVNRFYAFPRNRGNISIVLNYITFFFTSFFFTLFNSYFKKSEFSIIFCPSPLLTALPIIFLSKIFKKKVILWVLDLWPDTLVDLKIVKNKYIIKILSILVKYIYDNSDLILAQSNSFAKEIQKISRTECVYFPSWPEENIHLDVTNNQDVESDQRLKILFAGNIGEAQGFESIIECSNILKKKKLVKWIIAGDGRWRHKLEELILKYELRDDIQIINKVPIEKVGSLLNTADLLLVTLKKNSTFEKTIPGKLQTYMSSGKPILGMISGEANTLINESQCGFVCQAEDYRELANLILKFSNLSRLEKKKMGDNGLKYVRNNFNKINILNSLEKSLIRMIR
jgi:glycosyltransferase involved in cell wall biosynthesis